MSGDGESRAVLIRIARRLGRSPGGRKAPANLLFVTDPQRTPDPLTATEHLPRGAAVVYRHFGAPDALAVAQALRALTRQRGVLLLIGADEALAAQVRADGLHLPERIMARLPDIRRRRPRWSLTAAAHTLAALKRAEALGADAALLSPVFQSRSTSAGAPIGPGAFARFAAEVAVPVIALGGVDAATAPRLLRSGAAGLAAVDGWLD